MEENNYHPQPNQEEMVGDLPLLQRTHFQALGEGDSEYWTSRGYCAWDAPNELVALQRHLYERGKRQDGDDVVPYNRWNRWSSRDHDEENELTLVSNNILVPRGYGGRSYFRCGDEVVPYHPDILPHWEAFAEQQKKRRELELFKIDKISIPTAPFFEQKLLPMLKKNDGLVTLELNNCDLGADDIAAVAKLIKKNKSLSTLDLSGNKINSPGAAKALAKAIKSHPDLSLVNLSGCKLGGYKNHTKVLSNILGGCKNLKSLLLDYNRIGIGGKDNEISTEEITLVTDFIATNTSVTVLSLFGNAIDNAHDARLSKALKKNDKIRQLSLGSNGIVLPKLLFGSKRVTENLTHLDLCFNNIRTPGAKLIAKYLKGNPPVEDLNLGGNRIAHAAAKDLVEALKQNTNIQSMDLRGNLFNNKSVPDFVDLLKNNTTLLCLDLSNNNIKLDRTGAMVGKKELIKNAVFDTTSLETIANSNHTCKLILTDKKFRNDITHEDEMKKINSLDASVGTKIRYKVVLALFTLEQVEFNPRLFDDVPLELMPRLLEIAQQELGFGGFGTGVVDKNPKKISSKHALRRVYQVFTEWNIPLLVQVSYLC